MAAYLVVSAIKCVINVFKGILSVHFCTLLYEGTVNEKSTSFEEISRYNSVNIEHFGKLHFCKISQP